LARWPIQAANATGANAYDCQEVCQVECWWEEMTGEPLTATHKLEFAKRVAHFRRLFAGAPHPQAKSAPPRVHGKATQTGRKLADKLDKPKPIAGPHFKIG
jgi:hypothetical protein